MQCRSAIKSPRVFHDTVDTELIAVGLLGAIANLYERWFTGAVDISRHRAVEHIVRTIMAHAQIRV
nr:hypothetical protein GCM10017611_47490 [Rhodococcus wratislaviensis]